MWGKPPRAGVVTCYRRVEGRGVRCQVGWPPFRGNRTLGEAGAGRVSETVNVRVADTGGVDVAALTSTQQELARRGSTSGVHLPQRRISYFDWMRATAVVGVVVYHTLQPFGSIGWFISNAEISPVLTVIILALSSFGLPILFVVAGASARFALQQRSPRAFLVERARRLLVPFALGAIVFGPINGYTIGVFNGTVSQSFLEYVIAYPGIVIDFQIHNFGLSRLLLIAVHLWFLGALFLYSAAALPVFAFLSSTRGRFLIESLSRLARLPASTLLFAVPATVPIYLSCGGR